MKNYRKIYLKLCSIENLNSAFKKAREDKASLPYVIKFEKNLVEELKKLQKELSSKTYKSFPLKRFIIRDPKTRTIHASAFRDRVVYHALVNILEPIFDPIFIHDSYASRKGKGTLKAVQRFDHFKRKISKNGRLAKNAYNKSSVVGYVLKADIKHYFDTVDHERLLRIVESKIKDENVMWLIKQVLVNFDSPIKGKGMPLGNLTSQFFANVYLNELDQFVKHKLKAKYYIRYVDDFVILHNDKGKLLEYKDKIGKYLMYLKLGLHPTKSNIIPLRNGIAFLGYRIFYHHKLLRKSNIDKFERDFNQKLEIYEGGGGRYSYENLLASIEGWFGYAMWANTYKLRREIIKQIRALENKCSNKTLHLPKIRE
ncbi:hypothetical protein HYV89_00590 [Candidatus Woesearchaeota archaeon]|nr:hypothetical protein [Candidatus Woesearchaeota archaeon]